MVNSTFVSDAEWNTYINQSYFELYDIMVQKYGDDYFIKNPPYSFTTDGTNYLFAFPSDFYKLVGLDLQLGNTDDSWVTIRRFNMADRNRYSVPNFQSFYGVTNLRYRPSGTSLWLTPTPSAGQLMRLWYVPRLVELASDTDVADGVSGWLEYVVVDAAIKALNKEETDVSVMLARKQGLLQRIEAAAENRDAANPMTVADNQQGDYWWPSSGGGNGNF
jgi:hypothetical protein